jgi:hypothetical protein
MKSPQPGTVPGAIVAALIVACGSILAMFQQDPDLTFGDFKQSTIVVLVGTALLSFLKDYQALSSRRFAAKLTKRSEVNSPAFIAVLAVLVLALSGCTNLNNIIGGGALTVKTAADVIYEECGNTVPDGPCVPHSRISTEQKNELKQQLLIATDWLAEANHMKKAGDVDESADALEQANKILKHVESVLISRGVQ